MITQKSPASNMLCKKNRFGTIYQSFGMSQNETLYRYITSVPKNLES